MLTLYLMATLAVILYRDSLVGWFEADTASWQPDLTVLFVAFILALVPAAPYTIVAALIGVKYGPAAGSLINLTVSISAAVVLFSLVRYVFPADQRRKAAELKGISKLTELFERNAFLAVLFARLLPIVPSQTITIYAALTRMRWPAYLAATILGKIPYLVTVTVLGNQISHSSDWTDTLIPTAIYASVILFAGLAYRQFKQRL